MRQDRNRLGALVALLWVTAACAPHLDPVERLTGKWDGKPDFEVDSKDPMAAMAAGMLEAMGGASLELKADKSFDLRIMFLPMEGTWEYTNKTVVLTPTKVMGLTQSEAVTLTKNSDKEPSAHEPMVLTVEDDFGTLRMAGSKKDEQGFVFSRKS